MHQKYFIAIIPPQVVSSEIYDIKMSISEIYHTKGSLRSPAHITLHMPFSWDDVKEEKLISSLMEFQYTKEINIELTDFNCFEPRVVFVSVAENVELNQLQKNLVQHCKKQLQLFNQAEDMRGFHPHITVAFRDLKKPQFYKVWEEYKSKNYTAKFLCNTICLLKHVDDKWIVYKEFKFIE